MKAAFFKQKYILSAIILTTLTLPVLAQTKTTNDENPKTNQPSKTRKYLFASPTTKRPTAQNGNSTVNNDGTEKVVQISRAENTESANGENSSEPKVEQIDPASVVVSSSPEGAGIISKEETPKTTTETVDKSAVKTENSLSLAKIDVSAKLSAWREKLASMKPSEFYKVGAGDVLDIRILNASSADSTLYTILEGGILDFPLAGEPMNVKGLTTEEINLMLTEKVKLYENPQIAVSVRDFQSHKITILGLVEKSGVKSLRREAVPLYVALAESVPQTEAKTALIIHADKKSETVNLDDPKANEVLVYADDVIRVSGGNSVASSNQFFFIIGAVNAAGQKDFHSGLTLTQSVFAAGGLTKNAGNRAVVMRQNADGLLVTVEYNLKQIRDGKVPDPILQAGDRIEIGN